MIKLLPSDHQQWRASLYAGEQYLLAPNPASLALTMAITGLLQEVFDTKQLTDIHNQLTEQQFFDGMSVIRKHLFTGDDFMALLVTLLKSVGFKTGEVAFEPLRLRAIRHNGHLLPQSKAVYSPHRDTWYGHSQSMMVGWLALHDQQQEQTFEIFPDYFHRSVPNNSEVFDYDQWRQASDKRIGWQKKSTGLTAVYPQTTEEIDPKARINFSARTGETLYFSGSHFHQTLKQSNNLSRFSVDYRIVHLKDDAQGLGAVNVDNRSKGSALVDYIPL